MALFPGHKKAGGSSPANRRRNALSHWWGPVLAAFALIGCNAAIAAEAEGTNAPSISLWDSLFRASVAGGYRDNVLLTSVAPESSPLVYSSVELSFLRLSDTGSQVSLFLFGEDWRYTDAPSVGSEQIASASAQGSWFVSESMEAGGELQYIFQNQVVDVSENDAALRRLLVKGHGFWGRPRWKWNMNDRWAAEVEGIVLRQLFETSQLDDYWEPALRASLIRKYGYRSEASLVFQAARRLFDSRSQDDADGVPMPGTTLSYWRPEVGARLRHFWDKDRRWRTTTRLSHLWNMDNGSGYFDYGRVVLGQQVRWANANWEIKANARFGWYSYDVQRVSDELRDRSYCVVDMRVERRLSKNFFVFVTGQGEWGFSNDPLDRYDDFGMTGGAGVEF